MTFDHKAKLETLPRTPGVYMMKDAAGDIFYIGKAKRLRDRVRSYFNNSDTRPFVARLPKLLADIEVLLTRNEKEALLLEASMIRQYQPRYNVMLRGGRNHLQLRIDARHEWPRVEIVRRRRKDGAHYFGPYYSSGALWETLRVLNRHFKLRTCRDSVLKNRARPCLQYQIKRCPGPCVLDIDRDAYLSNVTETVLFLQGRRKALIEQLQTRMQDASKALAFEQAALLRDQIQAIRQVLERQEVILDEAIDQDIFALYREGERVSVQLMVVREGRLQGGETFHFEEQLSDDGEILEQLLVQFYTDNLFVPDEILLSHPLDAPEVLIDWLNERRKRKLKLKVPQRGRRHASIENALKNAAHQFKQHQGGKARVDAVLLRLRTQLDLNRLPRRIECFDISNLQGESIVASMVAFVNGQPSKQHYRTFKIRTTDGQDDFASMNEVLTRRYRKLAEGEEDAPDLVVIDGGKGQLSSALEALVDLGVEGAFDLVSLAKSRTLPGVAVGAVEHSPERVFKPGVEEPVIMSQHSDEVFLLQRVRDEAHRTAIGFHRKVRSKNTLRSRLDDIPGVGPKRKKALLQTLGSLARIRAASIDKLVTVPGVNAALARKIKDHLGD